MSAPREAINQQFAWKNPEMRRFAVALIRAALAQGGEDFTTDIVDDSLRGDGHGIAGSVATVLKDAHVIHPVGVTQNGIFYAHRRQSERPGAKARYVNVYKLADRAVAAAFLRANSAEAAADVAPVSKPRHYPHFFRIAKCWLMGKSFSDI